MRVLRSFTVRAKLPEPLAPLHELAMNLRWSWDERTRDLFRWIDPDRWEVTGHDPVRLIGLVSRERLDSLAGDNAFMGFMREVHADLRSYLSSPRWFQGRREGPLRSVAYLSPEFGIAEALPQYSGGLGVLAGDHLKAASDLGVPMVGVGLFYREGYFRQELNVDGWQQERYPVLDPFAMALTLIDDVRVTVDLAGTPLRARILRADVGRVPLYLLDADIGENDDETRAVTNRLYGGGTEHRIRQEILLGMGGVRALQAVGADTQIFHTNEGHAGFLGLERIRQLIVNDGMTFEEAVECVRSGTIFTTHTPVPAGIDRFPRELMERYFSDWCEECGIDLDTLMALGHFPGEPPDAPFNMAVMGLRLAGMSNGVSKLHGRVSRDMFNPLWPGVPTEEVPITSITNGVHAQTWVSSEMDDLLTRHVLPTWHEADAEEWDRIANVRDDELWRVREQGRERLVSFVQQRMRASLAARGLGENDQAIADEMLDPRILTIGFARRFATYKRATLLLSQPERLKDLLFSLDHPVQLVFAGKAHPADDLGKAMIRNLVQFSSDPLVRNRLVFIEDYDIAVARLLYQGVDVWLNNPRRPLEACGTSGEKAALNGALNCSIRDGWWDEMFNGENGWAISSAETYEDVDHRDEVEAESLFELLERRIVPLFYERSQGPVPRGWVRRVKASLRSLGPQVVASRMVRDYVEKLYEPVAARSIEMGDKGYERARSLARWKARVATSWDDVHVESIDSDTSLADLGAKRDVDVVVSLGSLTPDDVSVQLLHGAVATHGELVEPSMVTLSLASADNGKCRYTGSFPCERSGRYGLTVRVVPHHHDLANPMELGRVAWGDI